MSEREKIEAALKRHVGPSPGDLASMREADETAIWGGRYKCCGAPFKGTLAQAKQGCPTCV